jgi:Flp pilus assembly protein TadB
MTTLALLATALLFGGMVFYSFGFAAFLLTALPPEVARPTIRAAFPHFYLFVIGSAAAAGVLLWPADPLGAALLALIALTTVPARQVLMPAINCATDAGAKARFKQLHGLSVLVTLAHIGIAGYVLARLTAGAAA